MKISSVRNLSCIWALSLLSAPSHLQAASEFTEDFVPVELVREIVGDGEFYESLPDGLPLPDVSYLDGISLHLVGSWDTKSGMMVFLRVPGNVEEPLNALRDAYVGNGWTNVSAPWSFGPPLSVPTLGIRGISPLPPGSPTLHFIPISSTNIVRDPHLVYSLCHDQLGSLGIQTTVNPAGGNSIRISYQPASISELFAPMTCQERQAYNDAGYPSGLTSYFQTLLPILELPEGTVSASTTYGATGFSPIGRVLSLDSVFGEPMQTGEDSRVTVPGINLAQLYGHYSLQLEEQGWIRDSSAVGSESRSSVWVKTAEGPDLPGMDQLSTEYLRLQGVLTLLDSGNDSYQIWFRMTSR